MALTAPATPRRGHVAVVGAGIVGSATAHALAREGWQVTLIDARAAPGQAASLANGAQLSYSYVEPLATPATLAALPSWLLAPDSPTRWRPQARLAHWRWLAGFVAACTPAQVARTTEALLALSFLSRDRLTAWLAALPPTVRDGLQHRRPGKLVLYRREAARAAVQRQLATQAALGCEQHLVDAEGCRRLEPALAAGAGGPVAFGVWTPSEETIDAAALAGALAAASGARLRVGRRVGRLELGPRGIEALHLSPAGPTAARDRDATERLAVDHVVLCAGSETAALLRPLGGRLAIEPVKGYSVSLPILDAAKAPTVNLTDTARKLVHARLGDRLRVAGFAELCGPDLAIDPARIDALCAAVAATFPGACRFDDARPWAGLRPATPHGRPVLGPTRWPGVWLNAGHGALGLTLAAGSASLLADWLAGRERPIATAPFAAAG